MYGEGWIEVVFGGKVGEGEAGVGVGARACVYPIYECVCVDDGALQTPFLASFFLRLTFPAHAHTHTQVKVVGSSEFTNLGRVFEDIETDDEDEDDTRSAEGETKTGGTNAAGSSPSSPSGLFLPRDSRGVSATPEVSEATAMLAAASVAAKRGVSMDGGVLSLRDRCQRLEVDLALVQKSISTLEVERGRNEQKLLLTPSVSPSNRIHKSHSPASPLLAPSVASTFGFVASPERPGLYAWRGLHTSHTTTAASLYTALYAAPYTVLYT